MGNLTTLKDVFDNDNYLWNFYFDYGRSGGIEGLFVATKDEVSDIYGKEVNFGEALGKHSEVYGTLSESNFSMLDVSPESVLEVSKHLGKSWSGYNPFDYVTETCEDCGDSNTQDDWIFKYRDEFDRKMCEECYEDLCEKEGEAESE